ncbi:MAG TPA: TadE/TadG family type IV pilus assembly protein [Candidatus Limnocylindrales bacterium]|nr:TadE/TadG family type IV pilus assembly protein [Candidatus Limnocylindrales bacterium]
MSMFGRRSKPPRTSRRQSGQSVAEFAVILPVVLLLLVAIADLGRLYTSAMAVESAAREAADFGAFEAENWTPVNISTTLAEMERRACTAAAGSHLQDYETTDPVNHTSCTNPTFVCTLERNGAATDCASSGGFTNGVDCSDPLTEPPCSVHIEMNYQFHLLLAIPPLPGAIAISRDSYFRISDLTPP